MLVGDGTLSPSDIFGIRTAAAAGLLVTNKAATAPGRIDRTRSVALASPRY